jgi:hypothetical protein
MTGELAGRSVFVAPSTVVQPRLDFYAEEEVAPTAQHAGLVLHAVVDGDLISHVQTVH